MKEALELVMENKRLKGMLVEKKKERWYVFEEVMGWCEWEEGVILRMMLDLNMWFGFIEGMVRS